MQLRMLPLQANCHDGLARVAEAASDLAQQRVHREKADSMAEAMDMELWAAPAFQALAASWLPRRFMRR